MMKVSREGDSMKQTNREFYYPEEGKTFTRNTLGVKAWFWIHCLMRNR